MDQVTAADFSFINLFLNADWIVKTVIIVLLVSSILSWSAIFAKATQLTYITTRGKKFRKKFWKTTNIKALAEETSKSSNPYSLLFNALLFEWQRAGSQTINKDYLIDSLLFTVSKQSEKLEAKLLVYITFLASVGSITPFIGLLGTVWGIMNSFQSIAQSQQTHLAVVAPGIAEALFATALGLFAAIPAVFSYNLFVRKIGRITADFQTFGNEFVIILSKKLN